MHLYSSPSRSAEGRRLRISTSALQGPLRAADCASTTACQEEDGHDAKEEVVDANEEEEDDANDKEEDADEEEDDADG